MAQQERDLERIIELIQYVKEDIKPWGMINSVNNHDRYQYSLMKDDGLIEYENYPIGDNLIGLTGVRITSKGQVFIDSLADNNNYAGVKEMARKQGRKLTGLPLDMVYKLGVKWLENELGL